MEYFVIQAKIIKKKLLSKLKRTTCGSVMNRSMTFHIDFKSLKIKIAMKKIGTVMSLMKNRSLCLVVHK